MGTTGSAPGGARERFVVTDAERRVADLLAIEVAPALARATVETAPFWFHTFALNRAANRSTSVFPCGRSLASAAGVAEGRVAKEPRPAAGPRPSYRCRRDHQWRRPPAPVSASSGSIRRKPISRPCSYTRSIA